MTKKCYPRRKSSPPKACLLDSAELEKRTFEQVVASMNASVPQEAKAAIKAFVAAAKAINPLVEEIYAFCTNRGAQIFTVVSGKEGREALYEIERVCHLQFPAIELSFRLASRADLTPEQIEALWINWMPQGKLKYKYERPTPGQSGDGQQ